MTGREVVVEDYGPGDLLLQVEWHMPNSTGGSWRAGKVVRGGASRGAKR